MDSLSLVILLICKTLLDDSYVTAEGFGDPEMGDYNVFVTENFADQLAQAELSSPDPLAQNDNSLLTDPLSFNDVSTYLLSGSDLLPDTASLGCSSFDTTQDQIIGKRLDQESDEDPQLCRPQRSNPGKYPGFDPDNDPLVPLALNDPEDEELCPRQLYSFSPSYLVCDSGYFIDRRENQLTGLFNLDRCQRSTIFVTASSLYLFERVTRLKTNFYFQKVIL